MPIKIENIEYQVNNKSEVQGDLTDPAINPFSKENGRILMEDRTSGCLGPMIYIQWFR